MIRMKVRASIKKISPDDKIVRRKGRVYIINKLKIKLLIMITESITSLIRS